MQPAANGSKFWAQLRQAAVIVNGGILIFGGVNLYRGNEKFYDEIAMPMLRLLDAERAHKLSIKVAQYKLVPKPQFTDPPSLKTKVWGKDFPNPVGLAAGFDKQGEAVDGLLKCGFGFVEVGSITPQPQEGNAKPRVFRLTEDKAVINRYGFNSDGHDAVYERLHERNTKSDSSNSKQHPPTYIGENRNMLNQNFWTETESGRDSDTAWIKKVFARQRYRKEKGIMGVNLGKNKTSPDAIDDYIRGVHKFGPLADYLVVNVSSPNTPGLRDMQRQDVLAMLLDKVVAERNKLNPRPPLLVKISPDLTDSERKDIAAVITRPKNGVDGLIVSNTTIGRPESLESKHKAEVGGLSGVPLKEKSTQAVRDMYRLTHGRIPIVGVGGVGCGQDAYEKIKAGASLVQLYTAMVYQGPPAVTKIKRELHDLLQKDGYEHISEAVGIDSKDNGATKSSQASAKIEKS